MPTDTERLNFLQYLMINSGEHAGSCILRKSTYGRGFRLHESKRPGSTKDVRQQIDNMMKEMNWKI